MEIDAFQRQANSWLAEKLELLGCSNIDNLTHEKCKTPVKEKIASILHGALIYMNKHNECIENLKNDVTKLRVDLIESQRSVVKLQEQLIDEKDVQLHSMQQTVTSSVHESVKQELKSYSKVAATQRETASTQVMSVTPETLKTVVRSVVELEDRSRNVMLFGVAEEDDEKICEKVGEIFESLGQKPQFDAHRVGRKGTATRPVKVLFKNVDSVKQIIANARALRVTENFKKVFVSPDLCLEDRVKQRQLVLEMKRLNLEEPELKHFIRDGRVISVEKK